MEIEMMKKESKKKRMNDTDEFLMCLNWIGRMWLVEKTMSHSVKRLCSLLHFTSSFINNNKELEEYRTKNDIGKIKKKKPIIQCRYCEMLCNGCHWLVCFWSSSNIFMTWESSLFFFFASDDRTKAKTRKRISIINNERTYSICSSFSVFYIQWREKAEAAQDHFSNLCGFKVVDYFKLFTYIHICLAFILMLCVCFFFGLEIIRTLAVWYFLSLCIGLAIPYSIFFFFFFLNYPASICSSKKICFIQYHLSL